MVFPLTISARSTFTMSSAGLGNILEISRKLGAGLLGCWVAGLCFANLVVKVYEVVYILV